MNHVSPQGGSISRLYPTCYNTKVYTGGIYIIESVDSISRDGPDCPYM